jgi:hypothetical protein
MTLKGMGLTFADAGVRLSQQTAGAGHLQWDIAHLGWVEFFNADDAQALQWGPVNGFRVADAYGSTPLLQVKAGQPIKVGLDLKFQSGAVGPILIDRSTGDAHRLYFDGGVLMEEIV